MTNASLRIELPADERGRAPDTIRRFDKLQRKLQNPRITPKEREAVLAELAQIEHAPADRAEAAWARDAVAETVALAEARGEEPGGEGGLRRILNRDPLLSLARAGHLTADQLETGQKVRDLYDERAAGAGGGEFTGMPSAAHNHETFVARAFARAKTCSMVVRIEMAVHTQRHDGLTLLRAVCERGEALATQGKGRSFERNAIALAAALDVADMVLRRQA